MGRHTGRQMHVHVSEALNGTYELARTMQEEDVRQDNQFMLYQRFEELNDDILRARMELDRLKQERREMLSLIFTPMETTSIAINQRGGAP